MGIRRSAPFPGFLCGVVVFVLSLAVYVLTLAPDLTWAHYGADGGDLIAASFTGGVAHPPGYPLYLMLGRAAATLPVGNVPFRYNLFSAFAAAGAAMATAWTASRLSRGDGWRAAASGLGAGLALAFAPLLWEQSVITEVYALNALLSAAVVALSARAPRRRAHCLALVAVFGLAAGHHLTLACFSPLVAFRLAQAGRAMGWGRVAGAALGGALLSGLPLVYLPLAARGAVVWGDPSTPVGLWWLISGALYRGYAFGLPTEQALPRVAVVAQTLVKGFTLPGVAVGLIGARALHRQDAPLMWTMLAAGTVSSVFAVGYLTADSQVYLIPLLAVFAVWIGVGWAQALAPRWAWLAAVLPVWILVHNWQAIDLHADHAARDFVNGIVAQAPEGAIVITGEDRHTFALWTSVFVEQARSDIIVVEPNLLSFDWYRAALRRNFPDLRVPESDDVNWLVEQNAHRPICRPGGRPPPWLVCK